PSRSPPRRRSDPPCRQRGGAPASPCIPRRRSILLKVLGQFWRLLKLTTAGTSGRIGIALYVTVLALELSQILVSLRMIEWSKTFYDALQQLDGATAMTQVGVFGLIVLAAVALTLGSTFVRKHLEIRWRS